LRSPWTLAPLGRPAVRHSFLNHFENAISVNGVPFVRDHERHLVARDERQNVAGALD
jgi:hypothetical protein